MQYVVTFLLYPHNLLLIERQDINSMLMPMNTPIEEKVGWAANCYRLEKDRLLRDKGIADLLIIFRKAATDSHITMTSAGVYDACKKCEDREGGSCCARGIEAYYSAVMLLINLLLERDLPKNRLHPGDCFFLQKSGCTLLARHVICVNYLCKKITDMIEPERIAALREKEGIELDLLFHLEERIKKLLRRKDYERHTEGIPKA